MEMRATIRQCVIVVMACLAASLTGTASTHSAETAGRILRDAGSIPRGSPCTATCHSNRTATTRAVRQVGVARPVCDRPTGDGSQKSCSTAVEFVSGNPAVVTVTPEGIVRPVADGTAPVRVTAKLGDASVTAEVTVTVKEAANESASFLHDVMPLLSKRGCNAAQCHGSPSGKGGFKLSLFGADPGADYDALTRAHVGRRINRVEPIKSLVLVKSMNATAHTGGVAIAPVLLSTRCSPRGSPRECRVAAMSFTGRSPCGSGQRIGS